MSTLLASQEKILEFLRNEFSRIETEYVKQKVNKKLRTANFKLLTLAFILGFIISPSLALLIKNNRFVNPLIIPFLVAFLLGLVNLLTLVYNFRNVKEHNANYARVAVLKTLTYAFNNININIRKLTFSYLLCTFGFGLFINSMPLMLALSYGYSHNKIGQFFVVMTIGMSISMFFLERLFSKYINYIGQIKIGLIIMATLMMIYFLLVNKISWIGLDFEIKPKYITWIIAFVFYLFLPFITLGFTNLFANSVNKSEQGKVMSIDPQISAIASILVGLVIGKFNYNLILLIAAGFFIVSNIILYWYLSDTPLLTLTKIEN